MWGRNGEPFLKVSGVGCQAEHRSTRKVGRASVPAEFITVYYRIWSAQPATSSVESRPTLLTRAVPDT